MIFAVFVLLPLTLFINYSFLRLYLTVLLTAEHLLHCHPLMSVCSTLLFPLILVYSYIPEGFVVGMITVIAQA